MLQTADLSQLRDAASLVILKPGAEPELLLGKRAAGNRFMPNVYVFPGGALQADDFDTDLPPPSDAAVRLMQVKDAATARALLQTAVRETLEETHLTFTATEPLHYIGRAITPRDMPIRFNARFFVARAECFAGELRDSDELHNLAWFTPCEAKDLPLVDITLFILQNLRAILRRSGFDGGEQRAFVFSHDASGNRVVRWPS